jgi:hypothetical protein
MRPIDPVMPFGPHRSCPIRELPYSYLRCLAKTPPFRLHDWLAKAIEEEYHRRRAEIEREQVVELQIPVRHVPALRAVLGLRFDYAKKISDPRLFDGNGNLLSVVCEAEDNVLRQLPVQEGGAQ